MKQIAAFYHFAPIAEGQVEALGERLEEIGRDLGLRGLIIFANEGINGTISGETRETVLDFLAKASELLEFPEFTPKWSEAPSWPFRRFGVRLREEIVTLGKPEVQPLSPKSPTHLTPEEWDRVLREEDVTVLDTRNWYETRIGKFKTAIAPELEEFQQFPDYLERANLDKNKKVLIYCTGGIRCEKAIVEMQDKGFENVYQLDGGILNYLAQFPDREFEGECFVFDARVAVDQKLQPTENYKSCPHCGQPADQTLDCIRCDEKAVICVQCLGASDLAKQTCSKNCAYHQRLAPGKKGRSQAQGLRYESSTFVKASAAAHVRKSSNRSN